MPDKVLGDLKAQANANRAGERRILALIESYGVEFFHCAIEEMLRRSEEATRAAIRKVPNGVYSFEDFLDDSGPDTEPLRIKVTVEVKDDEIVVDFDGTSATVPAGMNSYFNFTYAYAFFSLKCLTDATIPANDGCRRAFVVKAPRNSLLNAQYPAPGGGRALVLTRLVEVAMGAMAQALPHRAVAASSDMSMSSFGCTHPKTGKPHVFYQLMIGGFGARPTKDGEEALCSALDMRNIPVEVDETNNPVFIERFEFVPDSSGHGRYRGGCAVRRDVRLLADAVQFSNLGERHRFAPFGLFGGGSGAKGRTVLNPGTEHERTLHSKGIYRLRHNDVVSIQLAGAGGWGVASERPRQDVLDDVLDGYVTPDHARTAYQLSAG